MRVTAVVAVTFVLAFVGSVLAQEQWVEFSSPRDGFRITFPGTPGIEDVTWTSQMGYALPARVFTVDRGREHYSVTVADYRGIEKLGIAKSQSCAPGAETCIGGQTRIVGPGYWKSDVHGAITYAVFMLLRRHGTPTGMTWNWAEQVEGTLLQFTNADQSRTSASIYMHDNRLYVIEGDVPKGTPEPELFKMSIGFIRPDGSGSNIYSQVYNNYMGLGESPLPDLCGLRGCNAVGLGSGAGVAAAARPRIRREDFPGLANYFPIDGTASNGGPIQSNDWAMSELWRRRVQVGDRYRRRTGRRRRCRRQGGGLEVLRDADCGDSFAGDVRHREGRCGHQGDQRSGEPAGLSQFRERPPDGDGLDDQARARGRMDRRAGGRRSGGDRIGERQPCGTGAVDVRAGLHQRAP